MIQGAEYNTIISPLSQTFMGNVMDSKQQECVFFYVLNTCSMGKFIRLVDKP